MVDFWAAWCGPCEAMAPTFEQAAPQLEPEVRLVKVNSDAAPELLQRSGIQAIPTLMLVHHGREIARQSGAMPLPRLLAWAREHAEASGPDPTLAEPSVHESNNLASQPFAKLMELLPPSLVREMDDEPGFQLPGNWLRRKFGVFPGWIVSKLVPIVVTNDPVVEVLVRHNGNSSYSPQAVSQRTGGGDFDELTTAS
ncbi:thioredoxin family protein [Bradyrhizobium erythrophlei]|uniref:thioredoxin family protein n=1 Tax=Bradyrhizobium erythrophlei TaxID=1437360 RepID=UPI003CC7CB14